MTTVYFNYPNSRITAHPDDGCSEISKQEKPDQRWLSVHPRNIVHILNKLDSPRTQFGSSSETNDLWISVTLNSPELDIAFAKIAHLILAAKFTPFANATFAIHDCPPL